MSNINTPPKNLALQSPLFLSRHYSIVAKRCFDAANKEGRLPRTKAIFLRAALRFQKQADRWHKEQLRREANV